MENQSFHAGEIVKKNYVVCTLTFLQCYYVDVIYGCIYRRLGKMSIRFSKVSSRFSLFSLTGVRLLEEIR